MTFDNNAFVSITKENYPILFEVFEIMSGAGHDSYAIPRVWEGMFPIAEASLAALSEEDREILCIGDCDEALAIVEKVKQSKNVYEFLTAFFNDFEE